MAGLFLDCVLPGCHSIVESIGEVCTTCRREFGDQLRPAGVALTEAQIATRDRDTRAAYAARGFA